MGKDCLFSGKKKDKDFENFVGLQLGGGYRDKGPPSEVVEKIPYFNAPIYLQNKIQIGKVDEIFGPINESLMEGIVATSYAEGDKFYIDPAKLLPLARFLPQPKSCEPLDFLEESCACQGEGGGEPPKGSLGGAIDTHFGSLKVLVKKMSAEGAALQGSGWVTNSLRSLWLTLDTTANQDDDKAAILVPSLLCSDLFVFVFHCSPLLPDKTLTRLVRSLLFHFSVT
ncbi:hypothetical protein YC2023_121757 [Brassica napus]